MKCCELYSGRLRQSIIVQREVSTSDGLGGHTNLWGTVTQLKAFINPTTGGERYTSQRLEAKITHKVYVRFTDLIKTSDRINFNGRLMQIRAIINLEERNRWLEIHAEEGVAI
jgi:SPP1 family predicted phage head-tail adaptor